MVGLAYIAAAAGRSSDALALLDEADGIARATLAPASHNRSARRAQNSQISTLTDSPAWRHKSVQIAGSRASRHWKATTQRDEEMGLATLAGLGAGRQLRTLLTAWRFWSTVVLCLAGSGRLPRTP
jgi:hypothetical protein